MKRFLTSIIIVLAGLLPANAQYTFTISASWSGNCSGYTAQMNQMMGKYKSQAINGFPTREICEQTRAMCHQELGHIELIWYDVKTGKEIKREATNCKLNVTTTPCTGRPMAGTVGTLNVLGVSQGTSFYSANSANEIQNWSSDDMERMLALDANRVVEQEQFVPIADSEYKSALIELNGKTYFRSLNIDEQGGMMTSSPDLDSFEPVWQMEKKSKKLPDVDVYAYKDRITNEAKEVLLKLLNKSDMSREELENKIFEWNYVLNHFALNESANYKEEKDILEKAYALAKYKVDYKAILNLKYIDGADEDKQATESAFLMVNGKTREQYYQEELQKKENELISKGISLEDIKMVKEQTEKESIVKDHVSTLEDISEGVGKFNEGLVGNEIVSQIVSGISEGATYGVMVNNLITIESYNIVADAINKQLDGLEQRHEKAEKKIKEQHDKIADIEDVLKATSNKEKNKEMNRSEALKWASNTDRMLNRVKGRSNDDYYGAFPDINKNEIIGREHITTIKCRL